MLLRQIESFQVDHTKIVPGIYVSRIDHVGGYPITTYDIRMFKPNAGEYLSTGIAHAIEHLGATWLRSSDAIADSVVYWGPMGCRTGFYAVMAGNPSESVIDMMSEMFEWASEFEGDVPGATEIECGNYRDMDLDGAKELCGRYTKVLEEQLEENPEMAYPSL